MNPLILEVKNLSHWYTDDTIGLDRINFKVHQGEFIILAGRNGSGKTTLFKHFNGLLTPTSGDVYLNGKPVSKNLLTSRKMVGMVFQDAESQIVGETVMDDIAFGPENLGLAREEINKRVNHCLSRLGLYKLRHRNPGTLSGGEKRKLAIAGVLAMEPEVLVLDEPFSNLDHPGSQDLTECLKDLHESGHTIIISTHDIGKLLNLASRMVIMDLGNFVADGRPQDLFDILESHGIRKP